MILLTGIALAAVLAALLFSTGYAVAGFLPQETRLTRLAIAGTAGLAWVILGASVVGAFAPIRGLPLAAIWLGALLPWLVPTLRAQLVRDVRATLSDPNLPAALLGLAALLGCMLLPYALHSDLVFYDGRPNHDSFFWCIGAEYLRHHDYLSGSPNPAAVPNRDHPLFNSVYSILNWTPVWGRMGAEGFLAVAANTFRAAPFALYNFAIAALAPAWILSVLALARRLGLPALGRGLTGFVCFCQPLFVFFFANGNFPNLLGALFAGGLWLLALLLAENPARPLGPWIAAGVLDIHGLLCSYPELVPFGLLPVGLLVAWQLARHVPGGARLATWLALVLVLGVALNPATSARAWNGFWNSVAQVQQDTGWANLFGKLDVVGYLPSVITLATSGMRTLGLVGGALATVVVGWSALVVVRDSRSRAMVLISLSGFLLLLAYTIWKSFEYGWQKSVQVAALPLAALFPALLVGAFQQARADTGGRVRLVPLAATLGLMTYAMVSHAGDIAKWAADKGLTAPLQGLRDRLATELPGRTITVDGATFRAAFFHSMWSARLFARQPIAFLPREEQPGGYLREAVRVVPALPAPPDALYYVAADWARAFDYAPESLVQDRVGALVREHAVVTEWSGFYRATGVPDKTAERFAFTIHPVADGWVEFTLTPNGPPVARCTLRGQVTTPAGLVACNADADAHGRLVVRFPLRAGVANRVTATLTGGPPIDPDDEQSRFPFLVEAVRSGRGR